MRLVVLLCIPVLVAGGAIPTVAIELPAELRTAVVTGCDWPYPQDDAEVQVTDVLARLRIPEAPPGAPGSVSSAPDAVLEGQAGTIEAPELPLDARRVAVCIAAQAGRYREASAGFRTPTDTPTRYQDAPQGCSCTVLRSFAIQARVFAGAFEQFRAHQERSMAGARTYSDDELRRVLADACDATADRAEEVALALWAQ